ncbi:MAG: hypothetical protein SGARI_002952 [Bacillariaceae sp.]
MTATTVTMDDPSSFVITAPVSLPTTLCEDDSDEENQKKKPKSFPDKPRKSAECEEGWRIPEAEGMEWQDDFFDDDAKKLVAVFDHDYKALMTYFIKKAILTNVHMIVGAYGWYRIVRMRTYAMHVAVKRDTIHLVLDNHLKDRPVLAGLHIFDTWLRISIQEDNIPFDLIVDFRTKGRGEVPEDLWCCCFWICGCCLKIPFETIETKMACDLPDYAEGVMWGLFEPKKLCDLVLGMKRDKGEQIHRDANKQRAKQAKRAEEQRALDSERRAQESQNMMQMMSMMMQQNRETMMGSQTSGQSPQSGPATNVSPQSSHRPPPPPPTR